MSNYINKLLRNVSLIFLACYVIIVFAPMAVGKLPIPADTIVGLYHPWRDQLASQYPNGVPFKNFLITDPVRQLYPWRELSLQLLMQGKLPLWNPFAFSGTPLLANFQSAAFYPLNFLLLLFGMATGWSLMIVLQVVLGGIFMWLFLRHLRLLPLAQALGVLSWVGSGFWVAWLEWNTLIQAVLWLPLLLLLADKIFFFPKKTRWTILFTLALATSFLAGHPQTFFYLTLVVAGYIAARIYQTRKYKYAIIFLLSFVFFLLFTFVQWWPFLKFLSLSARDIDPNVLIRPDWFIPWENLTQLVAPDFFGNPATLNYFGVWNYLEFTSYMGIGGLIFALLALFVRRDKKTLFFGLVLVLALAFALPTPLGKIPFWLQLPMISSAQPSRLIIIIDFALSILAALGLDHFLQKKTAIAQTIRPLVLLAGFLIIIGLVALLMHWSVSLHNLVLPFVVFGISSCLVLVGTLKKKLRTPIIVAVLLVTLFDLARFSNKFEAFSPKAWLFPQTAVTKFLQEKSQQDVFRVVALDDQILPPNFSVMYDLQTVSGYDPLYLRRYGEFIASLESNRSEVNSFLNFNRIITPKNLTARAFPLLNIKYVLSLNDISDKNYSLVFQEGQTKVYQVNNFLPRTFFVTNMVPARSPQEAMNQLLGPFSPTRLAVAENTAIASPESFSPGTASITKYSANEITVKAQNAGRGFLVLLDIYYPDWKAEIDGQPTTIYPTDYTFRGLVVPAGEHTIRFYL